MASFEQRKKTLKGDGSKETPKTRAGGKTHPGAGAAREDCSHTHPHSVPTRPCPAGAAESKNRYEVIVGNVGTVYSGNDRREANTAYAEYLQQSKSGRGRAGGEPVTFMIGDEIKEEWLGSNDPGVAAPKRRETGIRSYGPGKFYTILDSYLYEIGPDREAGDSSEGAGWYGLLYFHAPNMLKAVEDTAKSHNDTLTRDEKAEVKSSVGVILFERTDGIVESDWFTDKAKLERAWQGIQEEFRNAEFDAGANFSEDAMREGYTISDARSGGYDVAHEGKKVHHSSDKDQALVWIKKEMDRTNFLSNIYYVNDHGNVDLINWDGSILDSRV